MRNSIRSIKGIMTAVAFCAMLMGSMLIAKPAYAVTAPDRSPDVTQHIGVSYAQSYIMGSAKGIMRWLNSDGTVNMNGSGTIQSAIVWVGEPQVLLSQGIGQTIETNGRPFIVQSSENGSTVVKEFSGDTASKIQYITIVFYAPVCVGGDPVPYVHIRGWDKNWNMVSELFMDAQKVPNQNNHFNAKNYAKFFYDFKLWYTSDSAASNNATDLKLVYANSGQEYTSGTPTNQAIRAEVTRNSSKGSMLMLRNKLSDGRDVLVGASSSNPYKYTFYGSTYGDVYAGQANGSNSAIVDGSQSAKTYKVWIDKKAPVLGSGSFDGSKLTFSVADNPDYPITSQPGVPASGLSKVTYEITQGSESKGSGNVALSGDNGTVTVPSSVLSELSSKGGSLSVKVTATDKVGNTKTNTYTITIKGPGTDGSGGDNTGSGTGDGFVVRS